MTEPEGSLKLSKKSLVIRNRLGMDSQTLLIFEDSNGKEFGYSLPLMNWDLVPLTKEFVEEECLKYGLIEESEEV